MWFIEIDKLYMTAISRLIAIRRGIARIFFLFYKRRIILGRIVLRSILFISKCLMCEKMRGNLRWLDKLRELLLILIYSRALPGGYCPYRAVSWQMVSKLFIGSLSYACHSCIFKCLKVFLLDLSFITVTFNPILCHHYNYVIVGALFSRAFPASP